MLLVQYQGAVLIFCYKKSIPINEGVQAKSVSRQALENQSKQVVCMWLMCVAVALGALKTLAYLDVAVWPWVHAMSWGWVIGTCAATALWWWWADNYGYTQRKAQQRIDKAQAKRRERRVKSLMR